MNLIERITKNIPIENCPQPNEICYNDPNPDNAQLLLMVQELRSKISYLERWIYSIINGENLPNFKLNDIKDLYDI